LVIKKNKNKKINKMIQKMNKRLNKLNIKTIGPGKTIHIIGKRGSGKSFLLKDLLYNLGDIFEYGIFISPTYSSLKMAENYFPKCFIYEFDETNGIDNTYILKLLSQVYDLASSQAKNLEKIKKDPINVLIVLDDCMFDSKIMKSPIMKKIHFNGRHCGICFINCVQYMIDIPTHIRANIDYLFVFNEPSRKSRHKLYDYFFGGFNKFDTFDSIFTKATDNYGCIIRKSCNGVSNSITDSIFWYKASDHSNDSLNKPCNPLYFKLYKRFKRNEDVSHLQNETDEIFDIIKKNNE
jgi:hypothetical protein